MTMKMLGRVFRRGVRRRGALGTFILTLAALAVLAGCGGNGDAPADAGDDGLPREEKVLNIYNWTEYMPDDILAEFEAEYGVTINYDMYSSNEELLAKLQAGGRGMYDLIVPSDYAVEIMIEHGLLEPIDHGLIPNLEHISERWLDPPFDEGNRYSLPYLWGTVGIAYNKAHMVEPVTSFRDLWRPEYRGRVVLVDDSREVVGMALQLLGYSRNDTDTDHLIQAGALLKQLAPSVKAYDSDNPKGMLAGGEAWIGLVWNGEAVLAAEENPDIGYVLPREGSGLWLDNLAIPAGAPHKGWAHVFIDFLYRPEISARLGREFPYGVPNGAALELLPEHILANEGAYPDENLLEKSEFIVDVGDAADIYDRIYTEMKAAGGRQP